MPADEKLTPKRFWTRVEQIERLADLHGSRFEQDTPAKRRRRMAEAVVLPERFNRHYLPHYFRDEGCALHQVLYLGLESESFLAVRAPRGHGKTTVGTFAYALRQTACADVLRRWEQGTLQQDDPELHAEILAVIAEEVARRLDHGPLSCVDLGIPEHWDPTVTDQMDGWLAQIYQRWAETQTIRLSWDPYIQIVAVDADTAVEFTAAIRAELERNPLLRSDWGDLTPCHHKDWDRSIKRPASDGDFASNGIRVRAFGMTQSLRGGKHGQWRPTLLLGDDLDSEESTRTPLQRDRNIKKITSAGSYGLDERKKRIAIVGTPVDADCIVCRLTERDQYKARWVGLRFRARDEGGTVLYPAKWDLERLELEETEDEEAFGSELDDRPPSDGDSPFEELHTYDRAAFAEVRLAKALIVDPALGRSKDADLQAVVIVRGPTKEGAFLVDLTEGYRMADLIELCGVINGIRKDARPDVAAVETIGFQALFEVMLAATGTRQGLLDNWERIESHQEGKDLRIRGLARMSNKALILWPSDGSCRKGERQARAYPKGKRDILDALEMGVRRLRAHGQPHGLAGMRTEARRASHFGAGAW